MAVSTRFTGDAADLLAEQAKVEKGTKEIGNEYRKLTRETREAARIAEQALRRSETAQEKYERSVKAVRAELRRGNITLHEYSRAVDQLAQELSDAGEQGKIGFAKIASSIGLTINPLQLLQDTLRLVTDGFREARQEAEALSQTEKDSVDSLGKLAQVASDTQDFLKLVQEARQLRASGAVQSQDEAGSLRFNVRSAGFDRDLETFAQVGRSGLDSNLADVVTATRRLTTALGEAEVGNVAQIISKGLVASTAAQTELNQLLSGAAAAGSAGSRVGLGDEQILAAIAATADVRGVDVAATELRSLFTAFDKIGVQGDDIRELIAAVEKQLVGDKGIRDILGDRQEALSAFDNLNKNSELLTRLLSEIEQANDKQAFESKIGLSTQDQGIAASLAARQAEGRNEVLLGGLGTRETIFETQQKNLDALRALAGQGGVQRGINRIATDAQQFFGLTPAEFTLGRDDLAKQARRNADGDSAALASLEKLLQDIAETNRQLANVNTKPRPTVPEPEAAN